MARKGKGFTRRRIVTIAVGVILLIFLVNVTLTGGQDLFLANPFEEGLNFGENGGVFRQFSILDVDTTELEKYLEGDRFSILGKNCFTKLRTDVNLDNGQIIALNSRQQFFSALTSFALRTTTTGTDIDSFTTDLRMNCDIVKAKDGTELPFTINARPTQQFDIDVWGLDENGSFKKLKSNSVRLGSPVLFDNSGLQDPLLQNNILSIGSERIISQRITVSADEIENALGAGSTYTSRIEFRMSGAVDYNNLFLASKLPASFPIAHGLDQFLLRNSFDLRVVVPPTDPDIFGTDRKTTITSVDTGFLTDPSKLVTDGSAGRELVRVFASLQDYVASQEGQPIVQLKKQDITGSVSNFVESSETCLTRGTDGLNFLFECRLFIRNDINVGKWQIQVRTDHSERQIGFAVIDVVRSGAPVGTQCPNGQVLDALGQCQIFGSEGTGGGITACPTGQFKNSLGVCTVPDGTLEPCPVQGQIRDQFNVCVNTGGAGGVGTKSCVDCMSNVIRVIDQNDMCPVFQCDGFETDPDGIPNCSDNKPADLLPNGGTTCDRVIGTLGGLLPILVDCEGENRTANIERGEICAPAFIIGLFENLPLLIGIVIVLIIFFAILGAILKRSPAGRAFGAVRGFTS